MQLFAVARISVNVAIDARSTLSTHMYTVNGLHLSQALPSECSSNDKCAVVRRRNGW